MEKKKASSFGISLVAWLNFFFGFLGIIFGSLSFAEQPIYSIYLLATSLMSLISAIGLLELKSWGWWLAITCCVTSLVGYAFTQLKGFPLEVVVLPYLLWKKESFGVKLRRRGGL